MARYVILGLGIVLTSTAGIRAEGPIQVKVVRHFYADLISNEEVYSILAAGEVALTTKDGSDDVAVPICLQRQGFVTTFNVGNGEIYDSSSFDVVHKVEGNVKIVSLILWDTVSSTYNGSVMGVSKFDIDGMSIVVVRFDFPQTSLEGLLWMHEFGHNRGNAHRNNLRALMRGTLHYSNKRVNCAEAEKFGGGCGTGRFQAEEPSPEAVEAAKEFVRQVYPNGVSYAEASKLSKEVVPSLLKLLNDPREKAHWPNIVSTLAFIGDERAIKPLIEFIQDESTVDRAAYRAKQGALVHLGELVNLNNHEEGLKFLIKVAKKETLAEPKWALPSPQDAALTRVQNTAAIGLALSGSDEAKAVLTDLSKLARNKGDEAAVSLLANLQKTYQVIKEKGIKAYRSGDKD